MSISSFVHRLEEEQAKKEQLQLELQQDRATIEQLEQQLQEQTEQLVRSLQLSQEMEQRKEVLAAEESRLERAMLAAQQLQQSLRDQHASLEAARVQLRHSDNRCRGRLIATRACPYGRSFPSG
jgi:septal ring factor EnvC (AmiA/AmiB activator)